MPTSTTSTRDRLIEAAIELFHSQGYGATGLKQILAEAQVNAGSLYHYFKSKEDLLLAVLERYRELLGPVLIDPIQARVADPIERVFALLDGYRQTLVATDCTIGCPIGSLALELSELQADAQKLVAANFQAWRDAVRTSLQEAQTRFPPDVDLTQLATFVLTTMEGGVMQSRSYRTIDPFDDSVALLRDYFERLQQAAFGRSET